MRKMRDFPALNEEQGKIVAFYCNDSMRELRKMCDKIIKKNNNMQDQNQFQDDLYSEAQLALIRSVSSFDSNKDCEFKTYLYGNIKRSFTDWHRRMSREKRCNQVLKFENGKVKLDEHGNKVFQVIPDQSIDSPLPDGTNLADIIPSAYNIEDDIDFGNSDSKMNKFVEKLSKTGGKIAYLLSEGYSASEIKEKLNISDKEYSSNIAAMKRYENISILYSGKGIPVKKTEVVEMEALGRDKTKKDVCTCGVLVNQFGRGDLRKNHPLQRHADRWQNSYRDGFISSVIKQEDFDSIKICEQIIDGNVILWLIDGLQRLSTLEKYKNNMFKLGKNIEMPITYYQEVQRDENGEIQTDDSGVPIKKFVEYDLRGKYYKDLPVEVKEKFDTCSVNIVKHLNCTDEEVGYHIRRYNRQSSMNANETCVTHMDRIAGKIKKITNKNSFFVENDSYTAKERNNGVLERVCLDTLIQIYYPDNRVSDAKKMGLFLNDNLTDEQLEEFSSILDRLGAIYDSRFSTYFNSRNSFIFITMFYYFTKLGLDDSEFINFMDSFDSELRSKDIDGFGSYDVINEDRHAKNKSVIETKFNILTALMNEYFDIQDVEVVEDTTEEPVVSNTLEFIRENIKDDITEEDLSVYEEVLDDLIVEVDNSSKLLETANTKSLLAMVAYSFAEDIDLDDWFPDFFNRNSTYNIDQKENLTYMISDLMKFQGVNAA